MALKRPYPTFMLCFVLLGAGLALAFPDPFLVAPGKPPAPINDQFLRRHWDFPKTATGNNTVYCDQQTSCRKIHGKNNTFIHSRIININNICARKRNGPVTSQRPFRLTVCRFQSVTKSYKGMSLTRRIRVLCRGGLPVRYIRFIGRLL